MDFSNVIGQEPAKERLIQMVKEGRLPHALLFCGPEGVGKMALAMAFASYLLTNPDGEDNGSLDTTNALAMLRKWEHPDLHFSYPTIKRPNMSSESSANKQRLCARMARNDHARNLFHHESMDETDGCYNTTGHHHRSRK